MSEDKDSYTAEEYTPEIKSRKAMGRVVKMERCENCNENMVLPNGLCVQCGHDQGKIGNKGTSGCISISMKGEDGMPI